MTMAMSETKWYQYLRASVRARSCLSSTTVAIKITSRYEIFRNSAIRKAAAPSTGGDNIAPRPPAASNPPAASFPYPERCKSGQPTEPNVTVVATPDPEGPPSRNDPRTIARPALDGLPPIAANEK